MPSRKGPGEQWPLPSKVDIVYTGPDWLLLLLEKYDDLTHVTLLLVLWRCWSVRNGVLMAGEKISIAGSVSFLTGYISSLLQIRQQEPSDVRGKQKLCSAMNKCREFKVSKPAKR